MTPRALHIAQILWPAFIIAGILEMVVFAWVDPSALVLGGWPMKAQTVYTVAFFVFWGLIAISAELSHWMMKAGSVDEAHRERAARRHARRHARSMA